MLGVALALRRKGSTATTAVTAVTAATAAGNSSRQQQQQQCSIQAGIYHAIDVQGQMMLAMLQTLSGLVSFASLA